MPTGSELESRLAAAREAGREAAALTLSYFRRSDLRVERKADASPVTRADREAEGLLRARLRAAFPEDAVLGEEAGEDAGTSGFRWILDPIDGTRSFVHGVPLFGTLVGLEHGGRSVVGVMVLPALHEELFAWRGGGAWLVRDREAPQRLAVSSVARLADGLLCAASATGFDRIERSDAHRKLRAAAGATRGWGDCFGYALVASGRAEAMVDPIVKVWDCAAIQPIVEEAGGTFTDWNGDSTLASTRVMATNGHVLDEVLALLA